MTGSREERRREERIEGAIDRENSETKSNIL
jgi:hypothetical protein